MLKIFFPLSFVKKTVFGVIMYLVLCVLGSLTKGIIITFTGATQFAGYLAFFVSVYAFAGLFVLCLRHLGYIKDKDKK